MPTTLPVRRQTSPAMERRTLFALAAIACACAGLALIELAFTDTSASAEMTSLFSDIAEY